MIEHQLPARRITKDDVTNPLPGEAPGRAPLEGKTVRLEPLNPELHAAQLFAASHGSEAAERIWSYLPYGPFEDVDAFTAWVKRQAASEDPLFFAVRNLSTDTAQGMWSYLNIEPANRCIEIGHIWFGPALQNTRQGTEALYLMMAHTFDGLGYRRLEWKCDAMNEDSRRAALRLGFAFEGIFYQHRIVKGRNRDTAWYSLLDYEWPAIKRNFEAWLDDGNLDEAGKPHRSLRKMNGKVRAMAPG